MTCACPPAKRKVGVYESTQGQTEFCKTCGVTWPARGEAQLTDREPRKTKEPKR